MRYRALHRTRQASGGLASAFRGLKAVHYVGDATSRGHEHAAANGVNPGVVRTVNGGAYDRWRPARWTIRTGAHRDFPAVGRGRIKVLDAGLYLVYAQVIHPNACIAGQVNFFNLL